MKYLLYKSHLNIKNSISLEIKYVILKYLLRYFKGKKSVYHVYLIQKKLKDLNYKLFKFRRRCMVTNFSRSYKYFNISRIKLREFSSYGKIVGVKKAS